MVAAYRHPDHSEGKKTMTALITSLSSGVPKPLRELVTLGHTSNKRSAGVLAYFDRPGSSTTAH